MTRDEVIKTFEQWLEDGCGIHQPLDVRQEDALREAIALLTPPTTTHDIKLARDIAEILLANGYSSCDPEQAETLIKATYALAREPATNAILHRKNVRIAALESQLARVREVLSILKQETLVEDAICCHNAMWSACERLDAALAADAGPEGK